MSIISCISLKQRIQKDVERVKEMYPGLFYYINPTWLCIASVSKSFDSIFSTSFVLNNPKLAAK